MTQRLKKVASEVLLAKVEFYDQSSFSKKEYKELIEHYTEMMEGFKSTFESMSKLTMADMSIKTDKKNGSVALYSSIPVVFIRRVDEDGEDIESLEDTINEIFWDLDHDTYSVTQEVIDVESSEVVTEQVQE